jgi:hypothetical protein
MLDRTDGSLIATSRARHSLMSIAEVPRVRGMNGAGERVAAGIYGLSFIAITATVATASVRMWDDAHSIPREAPAALPSRAAASTPSHFAASKDCEMSARVPGAVLVQCAGWMSIIDDRDHTTTVEAGAIGLVQLSPPVLLRSDGTLAAWSPTLRQFDAGRRVVADSLAVSAVLRDGKLLTRESRTSDTLAYACGESCTAIRSELRYADDAPLTLDCGAGVPPRFQLVVLAPQMRESFDAEVARQRVIGLLDVERGTLAWTSETLQPERMQTECRDGGYVVQLDFETTAAMWVIDAETGARMVR